MLGFLSNLFSNKNKHQAIHQLMQQGAVIVDVRTSAEFSNSHISGAKNIPLQVLNGKIANLKKEGKPIITCCASGMRSGSATSLLKSNGIQSINGGAWNSLQKILKTP